MRWRLWDRNVLIPVRYIVFEMKNAVAFCYNSVNLKARTRRKNVGIM